MNTYLSVIGLGLDIVGASLIAKPIFFKSETDLIDFYVPEYYGCKEWSPYSTNSDFSLKTRFHSQELKGSCKEQIFVRVGLVILILGFLLQIFAILIPESFKLYQLIVPVLITIFIVVVFRLQYKRLIENLAIELLLRAFGRRVKKDGEPFYPGASGINWRILEAYSKLCKTAYLLALRSQIKR